MKNRMLVIKNLSNTMQTKKELLYSKDIWDVCDLGLKQSGSQSIYHFNFTHFRPSWLKKLVKQFIAFESATKAITTCRSYIIRLRDFGEFIYTNYPNLLPHEIDRKIVVEYLSYLQHSSWKTSTKRLALIHLRSFIETVAQEEWQLFPKHRIIFNSDLPKETLRNPRFIPEKVMEQLMKHLPTLPDRHRRLIFVLQETGRRISEICTLPFNCLSDDNNGTSFLEVSEQKTKKAYYIPITIECAKAIKDQQEYLKSIGRDKLGFLFLGKSKKVPHATSRYIHVILNQLSQDKRIVDDRGNVWHFFPHQFRHTVGTRMINAGVSQPIVQRYLGHETPEMTSRYAYIHDRSLKEAFFQFHGQLINIHGVETLDSRVNNSEEDWLKHNILAQALPNGYCGLPAKQNKCPHANACLTCTHFRTDNSFLQTHQKQLEMTNEVIQTARKNGWHRQGEMNTIVKINLETIIATIKGKSNEIT